MTLARTAQDLTGVAGHEYGLALGLGLLVGLVIVLLSAWRG